MQVPASRGQLLRAVREVWGSKSYEDQFRLAVFSACLNHGLARVKFCKTSAKLLQDLSSSFAGLAETNLISNLLCRVVKHSLGSILCQYPLLRGKLAELDSCKGNH